jgi:hypothetical protein
MTHTIDLTLTKFGWLANGEPTKFGHYASAAMVIAETMRTNPDAKVSYKPSAS